MKDRDAWTENRKTQGVPADEAKTLKAYGVPKAPNREHVEAGPRLTGVTMEDLGYVAPNYPQPARVITGCHGKNGTCKAHPVKETNFCIGHTKQNGQTNN